MPVTPEGSRITCKYCKKRDNLAGWSNWQEMVKNQACHDCNFWIEQLVAPANAFITKEYEHYRIGPEGAPKDCRGHGGRAFKIRRFLDGFVVVCDNLWSQGTIPVHLRHKFTPNGEFVCQDLVVNVHIQDTNLSEPPGS